MPDSQMAFEIVDVPETNGTSVQIQDIDLKNWVSKSNDLVMSTYKLTVQEQRILLILSSKVQPSDEELKEYKFRVSDFAEIIGAKKGTGIYTYIREVVTGLQKKQLTYKDGNRTIVANWLVTSIYEDNEGIVVLKFNPDLKRFFLHLKDKFTMYQLENVIQLNSLYSIRIYELLKQYENTKHKKREFTLEELRVLLGIEKNKLVQYGHLKAKVLKPAQTELKDKTDIAFDFEEVKRGRKVARLIFTIKPKGGNFANIRVQSAQEGEDTPPAPVPVPSEEQLQETLRSQLKELEVNAKTITSILKKVPLDQIQRNIEYVKENRQGVTSLGGFTNKAIREDYAKTKGEAPPSPPSDSSSKTPKGKAPIRTELLPDWFDKKTEEEEEQQRLFTLKRKKKEYLEKEESTDFNGFLERMHELNISICEDEEEAFIRTFNFVVDDYNTRLEYEIPPRFIKDFTNKEIRDKYRIFIKKEKTSK